MKSKLLNFQFSIPIKEFKKEKSLFSAHQVGELMIFGRGKYTEGPVNDFPYDLAKPEERAWVKIELGAVDFISNGDIQVTSKDILPVLANFKECAAMLSKIEKEAYNTCLILHAQKHEQ